jgi:MFS family permease
VIGQVVGVVAGSQIAQAHGWRTAFEVIGIFGLALALAYALVVRESKLGGLPDAAPIKWSELARLLLGRRLMWLTYFAGGIQLFCTGALAWAMPLLLTEHYGMQLAQAGSTTALFLLICAAGMIGCGIVIDRKARSDAASTPRISIVLSLLTAMLFAGAFLSPPGPVQLGFIAGGLLLVGGITGVTGAMIANSTPRAVHSTAMAVLALAYNLFGLAPGPFVTGLLADSFGLLDALKIMPLPCLLAALGMALASPLYRAETIQAGRNEAAC